MRLVAWDKNFEQNEGMRLVTSKPAKLNVPEERNSNYNWGMAEVRAMPAYSTMETVETLGASLVPFAKYLLSHEQEAWKQMDGYEKATDLAWETLGAATILGGGLIMKYGGQGLNKLQSYLKARNLMEIEPIEQALTKLGSTKGIWRKFDYQIKAEEILRGRKFKAEEANIISKVLSGQDPVLLKSYAWENQRNLSKAWQKAVVGGGATPYGGPKVAQEFIKELGLSREKVRYVHYRKLYLDNLRAADRGVNLPNLDKIAKWHVGKVFGEDVAKNFNMGTATDEMMSNLMSSVFERGGKKAVSSWHKLAHNMYRIPYIHPSREIYGAGEATLGTKTQVYDKIADALEQSNIYRTDMLNGLVRMLDERGFGELTEKGFKANKAILNEQNLKDAHAVLQKIDSISESYRKGGAVSAQGRKLVEELVAQTKERAPIVSQIVSAMRDYTDILYKDLANKFPLGLFNKIDELTPEGRAAVEELADKWGTLLDKVFQDSGGNTAERIKTVKKMLGEYSGLLKDPEKIFRLRGKALENLTNELKSRLTYAGKHPSSMPAYLEGYMPRVAQRGLSYESRWHTTLTGKSTASFMKRRTQDVSGPQVNSLFEAIEHRTAAQAKQLFFYDEADEVVKFARKLPDDWKKQVDFTLGRVLSRPTEWDAKVATSVEAMFGKRMDPYRAMNTARMVTGMGYTGMLGLRPFAALRNLTQPIISVPAELGGGVKDLASLIAGLGKAATKEHREYIKSIGAIAEFLPDQETGPLLPRVGKLAKWNELKDFAMYMFRSSDRFNRYWSGGAAVDKWDNVMKTIGPGSLKKFADKAGFKNLQPWVRKEVERAFEAENYDMAKKIYVRSVIDNTQYLYGALDMPQAMGSGGAERLVTMFNSWWMAYGSNLGRWFFTGDADTRLKRALTFMGTGMLAEQALELYAGPGPARRSMLFGPLPLGDLGMPPAIKPVWHLMAAAKDFGEGVTYKDGAARQQAYRNFNEMMKSTALFIPGGLAAQQFMKRGVSGVSGYNPEEFKPLFGWLGR